MTVIFDAAMFRRALNPRNGTICLMIVGLGNPKPFLLTRHNAGHYVCSKVQEYMKLGPYKEFDNRLSKIRMYRNYPGLVFTELKTFMNISGPSIQYATRWITENLRTCTQCQMFIVHDDLELGPGKMSYKLHARHTNGHNGLKSVVNIARGNEKIARMRIGIGRPESRVSKDVADYVLAPFTEKELKTLDNDIVPMFADILDVILKGHVLAPDYEPASFANSWTLTYNRIKGKMGTS